MPFYDENVWEMLPDGSRQRRRGGAGAAAANDDEVNATAGAVELADELGIDLADVQGSGSGGRVSKADVQAYADA